MYNPQKQAIDQDYIYDYDLDMMMRLNPRTREPEPAPEYESVKVKIKAEVAEQLQDNYKARTKRHFVMAIFDDLPEDRRPISLYGNDLKPQTLARLVLLGTYLSFNSDELWYTERSRMNTKQMKQVLGLPDKTFRRFLQEVTGVRVDKRTGEVIAGTENNPCYLWEDNNKVWHIDTGILKNGELQKKRFTYCNRIFIDEIRRVYNSVPISEHRNLGYIFSLLPFLHKELNIICHNPLEKEWKLVEPLTPIEICGLLGYNTTNASRFVKDALKMLCDLQVEAYDGKKHNFCMIMYTNNRSALCVNPNFIYFGRDEYRRELLLCSWMCENKSTDKI